MKKNKTHGVQLLIWAIVRDPDGKVISDSGRKPARSYLIQFLEFIYGVFAGLSYNATETDNTESVIIREDIQMDYQFNIRGEINDDAKGIVIGTGDTAVTNTDYKLETQLTEGIGAGNITHGAQVVGSAGVVGVNVDLELKRAFTNLTGSTITVKEAGLYIWTFNPFCIIRDVLAGGVEVPDKCSLTIIYTVRTTV